MPKPYSHEIDACFAEAIGAGGLDRQTYQALLDELRPLVDNLRRRRDDASLPIVSLPTRDDDVRAAAETAARIRENFADLVVLGIGGSSLGAQALAALARGASEPGLHFPDNLDGERFAELLAGLVPSRTAFLAVSKSGGTPETLAQTLVAIAWLRQSLDEDATGAHLIVITEPGERALRRLAARHRVEVIDHDPNIAGRYSVLSLVGLLPAMAIGLDVGAVRAGAASVLDEFLREPAPPPLAGAALAVGLWRQRAIATNVVLAYGDRLERFVAWHRQLWAESLGKLGQGLTPIAARGPVDQHSQLQLWLDGPADKSFTLIEAESTGLGPEIDTTLAGGDPDLAFLAGHRIGDLVAAEARATAATLIGHGRPTRRIGLTRLDEATLGALFMHFILETIAAAHLLGVDPFTQPAVDQGKRLARRYLSETAT